MRSRCREHSDSLVEVQSRGSHGCGSAACRAGSLRPIGNGPLYFGFSRGCRARAVAQLFVARPLHLARPPRRLDHTHSIIAVSSSCTGTMPQAVLLMKVRGHGWALTAKWSITSCDDRPNNRARRFPCGLLVHTNRAENRLRLPSEDCNSLRRTGN